jgi:3-phenylpropionate/trans-cinnamate dioxygenase ferredoxin component
MTDFVEVTTLDEVPPGTGNCFTVAGKEVALFNVDGTVYAIEDSCLHKGASLATGALDGKVVTCRAHGYGVASYPVKIVDGKILVAVA